MKITNSLFEQMLTNSNISKKEFSNYSKIPYNTVLGWKKRNQIPAYAIVLLKDMNYRKKLDIEISNKLRMNKYIY